MPAPAPKCLAAQGSSPAFNPWLPTGAGAAAAVTPFSSSVVLAVPTDYLLGGSGSSKCIDLVQRWVVLGLAAMHGICWHMPGGWDGSRRKRPCCCCCPGAGSSSACHRQRQAQPACLPACFSLRGSATAAHSISSCRAKRDGVRQLQFVPTLFWVDEGPLNPPPGFDSSCKGSDLSTY